MSAMETTQNTIDTLNSGATADIWYDAESYDDKEKQDIIAGVKEAMVTAAQILSKLGDSRWTVIADYGDSGGTYMTDVEAGSPEEAIAAVRMEMAIAHYDGWSEEDFTANDTTREERTENRAKEYEIIACIAGAHMDVKP